MVYQAKSEKPIADFLADPNQNRLVLTVALDWKNGTTPTEKLERSPG
jgi:hypothetical protein